MSDVAPIRPDPESEIKKALAGAGRSKPEVKPVAKGKVSKSIGATVARSIFADSISGVGNFKSPCRLGSGAYGLSRLC